MHYDYGVQLVRRGYVVAIPCFTPFGRRVGDEKPYKKQDACGITFIRMQALGKLLIAENLRDALWSLALLVRQPDVDTARLGCAGLSYGGRMTMLTTAVAPQHPRGRHLRRAEPDPGAHHRLLRLRRADHPRPARIRRRARDRLADRAASRACGRSAGRMR